MFPCSVLGGSTLGKADKSRNRRWPDPSLDDRWTLQAGLKSGRLQGRWHSSHCHPLGKFSSKMLQHYFLWKASTRWVLRFRVVHVRDWELEKDCAEKNWKCPWFSSRPWNVVEQRQISGWPEVHLASVPFLTSFYMPSNGGRAFRPKPEGRKFIP